MSVEQPAATGQIHRVRTQQVLSGVAILLFIGFFWARNLDWATLEIGQVRVAGNAGFYLDTAKGTNPGTIWDPIGDVAWVYAFLVVGANALFIFVHRHVDQFLPALVNAGVGALLTALSIYFIVDINGAMGLRTKSAPNVVNRWILENGAYPALVFGIGILAVGIAQGVIRTRTTATEPTAVSQPAV